MTSQNIHFTHLISSKLISSLLSADIIIQITILVKTFFLTKYQKIPPTLLDSMGTLWYNKHNTKDEKRDRFSVMCLLNRCEASRFAACTYGIISTRPCCCMYVYYVHERGKAARLASIESSFDKRGALACDVVAHFTDVKCECGIINTTPRMKSVTAFLLCVY